MKVRRDDGGDDDGDDDDDIHSLMPPVRVMRIFAAK